MSSKVKKMGKIEWTGFAEIQKTDATQQIVMGYASTPSLDLQGERISSEAIGGALAEYMEFGTIKEMHQPGTAAGVVKAARMDDKGLWIEAKIVDPVAWAKVEEGVYKGFSVGGIAQARDPQDKTIITKMKLREISLVDRPANPEAMISLFKADGMEAESDVAATSATAANASGEGVEKGLWLVSELAGLLSQLDCITQSSKFEEEIEQDGSAVPDKLAALRAQAAAILQEMTAEETKEMIDGEDVDVVELADKTTGGVAKTESAPAKTEETGMFDALLKAEGFAKTDSEKALAKGLKAIGDAAVAAVEHTAKMQAKADELAKAATAQSEAIAKAEARLTELNTTLDAKASELDKLGEIAGLFAKGIATGQERLGELTKAIHALENRPVPPLTGRVISRGEEVVAGPSGRSLGDKSASFAQHIAAQRRG